METVTIPKTEYRILEQRASLYDAILKGLEENIFPIEEYSTVRMRELFKEDTVTPAIRAKATKILKRR